MNAVENIARTILNGDALGARGLVQSWIESNPNIQQIPAPLSIEADVASLTAGLVELFAERLGQSVPPWTASIGKLPNRIYLVQAALRMSRLRALCEKEGPPQLRARGFYAPPDYLRAV